ncbi:MAG: hypothetical protein WD398_04475 [Cyclobacteriaceae bacterium]
MVFLTLAALNKPDNLVFNVGYTIVGFIIDHWGKDQLLELIKNGGEVYSTFGLTEKEFERQWERYVKDKFWIL